MEGAYLRCKLHNIYSYVENDVLPLYALVKYYFPNKRHEFNIGCWIAFGYSHWFLVYLDHPSLLMCTLSDNFVQRHQLGNQNRQCFDLLILARNISPMPSCFLWWKPKGSSVSSHCNSNNISWACNNANIHFIWFKLSILQTYCWLSAFTSWLMALIVKRIFSSFAAFLFPKWRILVLVNML